VSGTNPSPALTNGENVVDITVSIQTANFEIVDKLGENAASGEGHIHYFLDAIPPTFPFMLSVTGKGSYVTALDNSFTWTGVLPGVHLLIAELVNNDYTPLNPPILAGTIITVMPAVMPSTTASAAAEGPTVTVASTGTVVPTLTSAPGGPSPAGLTGGQVMIDP
jgi:hypothetical protein